MFTSLCQCKSPNHAETFGTFASKILELLTRFSISKQDQVLYVASPDVI